jgi:hypothetical protein
VGTLPAFKLPRVVFCPDYSHQEQNFLIYEKEANCCFTKDNNENIYYPDGTGGGLHLQCTGWQP